MNKDGFILLTMGYTGKNAMLFKLMYVNEFNRMRDYIKKVDEKATQEPIYSDCDDMERLDYKRRALAKFKEAKAYEDPFTQLEYPAEDKYIFIICVLLEYYDIKDKSYYIDDMLEMREYIKNNGVNYFDEVLHYCHKRNKTATPYILAVLRNYKRKQRVSRAVRLLA